LHEGDIRLREERHGLVQEIGRRHEIRIEDDEELARCDRQRMIDVASLGAGVALAHDVGGAQFGGECADALGLAVVQNVGVVAPVHGQCGGDRAANGVQVLAVGGDVDVDLGYLVQQMNWQRTLVAAIRAGLVVGAGLVGRPVETGLRVVEAVSAGIVSARQNRPQREQHLEDDHCLGGDDDQVGNPVATIVHIKNK